MRPELSKISKGLLESFDAAVMVKVIRFDVEDDLDRRRVVEERAVRLVGFSNEHIAVAEACARCPAGEGRADRVGRVESCLEEGNGEHARGCCLAVGAGNGNEVEATRR